MTQIKKTLSIAGIIALVGAPAMADIASTEYVQSIVNNVIPKTGTVGHVLKKTATGLEWAAAPTPTLETTTGQSTTASMTQKAITDALDAKLSNKSDAENAIAIGGGEYGAYAESGSVAIGANTDSGSINGVAIGMGAGTAYDLWDSIAIGREAFSGGGVVIGAGASGSGVVIGDGAQSNAGGIAIGGDILLDSMDPSLGMSTIQLGPGLNTTPGTFKVGFLDLYGEGENYTLLNSSGKIPAERLANDGSVGQVLKKTATGMQWADAPAPTLASLLPELPSDCNSVKCALVHDNTDGQYKWEVVKVSE